MLMLQAFDLSADPLAAQYLKTEVVQVQFARQPGVLISREGPNHFEADDALITGSTDDRWSVTRRRFDEKYQAVPPTVEGQDGAYCAKPVPVWAKQIHEAFTVPRRQGGDVLRGDAGDWLMQYGQGDYGLVQNSRFIAVYRPL